MRTVNKPYYICDHCNKKYFRQHACEKHEPICLKNPINLNACDGCKHLECHEKTIEIETFETLQKINSHFFECKKLKKMMYPYVAKKRNLPLRFPEDFHGQEQMPNKCKEFRSFFDLRT